MTENNKIELNALLFGIRYQRKWHVLDITGEIMDSLLRSKKSPFDEKYFTRVGEKQLGKGLINPDTDCSLIINIDDLIFKHVFGDNEVVKDKDIDWFFSSITDFIVPEIIVMNNFEQIIRVGIIFYHYIPKTNISLDIINKLSGKIKGETTKFNLDFHKKIGVEKALLAKKINDYRNTIFFMRSKDEETYESGIDFQYYFKPSTDNIKDFDFKDFFDKSMVQLNEVFYPWFANNFASGDTD
jgi:hypothetical protein